MAKYRNSFMTKVRWSTTDPDRADKSIFQWFDDQDGSPYTLSLLGVVNGLLPILPFHPVLVVHYNDETEEIERYSIKRKWW